MDKFLGARCAEAHPPTLSRQTSEVQSLWTPDRPGYTVTTTNRYDDNGDGSLDRAQVIAQVVVNSAVVNGTWVKFDAIA